MYLFNKIKKKKKIMSCLFFAKGRYKEKKNLDNFRQIKSRP